MKIQIRLNTTAHINAAQSCGTQIKVNIDSFDAHASNISVDQCGSCSFIAPSDSHGQDTCYEDSILIDKFCCE